MTKTEKERIKKYIDRAYDGIEEYTEKLEDTGVITEWLDKILNFVEGK